MRTNRSIPDATIIPVLGYADVHEAAEWLCRAFGFRPRLRIGDHRIQLTFGAGAMVVSDAGPENSDQPPRQSVMVRVDDANAHHAVALAAGARIVRELTDWPYGERQYSAMDIGGHRWVFTQTIADADPASWGGELVEG
ncbi:VOC family protein [Rhodanobacter sp. DHG33]|uniref:VOC family protein n=1 Tax=Rhodanobacter sp. DHG33 TaxID=2775921 RepID=UPI00177C95D3|nr:VOC family protein [Rhodanobacter sp. DHG33]MBD8899312.1 glyoxalase [Rhodanobacter sp. DHG33]